MWHQLWDSEVGGAWKILKRIVDATGRTGKGLLLEAGGKATRVT